MSSGWKHTDEWKVKRSEAYKGVNNPFYGKKHSQRVIDIISKPRTKIDIRPTKDWGYLIGLVLGDGWLHYGKGSYRTGVSSTHPEIVDCFHNVCDRLRLHTSYYKTCGYYYCEVCAKGLYEYLRPCKNGDFHFTVPFEVYKSLEMTRGFLQGFFDAEGGVYKGYSKNGFSIDCWSKHRENLTQIKECLVLLGISSYVQVRINRHAARLIIANYTDRLLFKKLVGFGIDRKQEKLNNMEQPYTLRYKHIKEVVVEMLNQGMRNRDIVELTGLSSGTVSTWKFFLKHPNKKYYKRSVLI